MTYDSAEQAWWRAQYRSAQPARLAAPWIAKWPVLVRCIACGKQLGHDPVAGCSSMHQCSTGEHPIGGAGVVAQPRVESIA